MHTVHNESPLFYPTQIQGTNLWHQVDFFDLSNSMLEVDPSRTHSLDLILLTLPVSRMYLEPNILLKAGNIGLYGSYVTTLWAVLGSCQCITFVSIHDGHNCTSFCVCPVRHSSTPPGKGFGAMTEVACDSLRLWVIRTVVLSRT